MEGDVLLKVLRPLQSPALGLAFDGLHGEHRGFFQHSQVRILAPASQCGLCHVVGITRREASLRAPAVQDGSIEFVRLPACILSRASV